MRLLVHDELRRILATDDIPLLLSAMTLSGELLVHGLVTFEDVQEAVDTLFDHAERNDEEHAVALCRFLARVGGAFDAYRLLSGLRVVEKIERVLEQEDLSHRTRYLLMVSLSRVMTGDMAHELYRRACWSKSSSRTLKTPSLRPAIGLTSMA